MALRVTGRNAVVVDGHLVAAAVLAAQPRNLTAGAAGLLVSGRIAGLVAGARDTRSHLVCPGRVAEAEKHFVTHSRPNASPGPPHRSGSLPLTPKKMTRQDRRCCGFSNPTHRVRRQTPCAPPLLSSASPKLVPLLQPRACSSTRPAPFPDARSSRRRAVLLTNRWFQPWGRWSRACQAPQQEINQFPSFCPPTEGTPDGSRSRTPFNTQRMKHCLAIHQGLGSVGSSRHLAPLRQRQTIASIVHGDAWCRVLRCGWQASISGSSTARCGSVRTRPPPPSPQPVDGVRTWEPTDPSHRSSTDCHPGRRSIAIHSGSARDIQDRSSPQTFSLSRTSLMIRRHMTV